MEELVQSIQKIIKQEIGEKFDILNDNIAKLSERTDKRFDEIDKKFETVDRKFKEIDQKFESIDKTLKEHSSEIRSIRDSLFIIEHEHGKKLDALYDLVYLDKELNEPKFNQISKISKKSNKNYLHILDHENRISTLEKKYL